MQIILELVSVASTKELAFKKTFCNYTDFLKLQAATGKF
jgi:hypothetical protein